MAQRRQGTVTQRTNGASKSVSEKQQLLQVYRTGNGVASSQGQGEGGNWLFSQRLLRGPERNVAAGYNTAWRARLPRQVPWIWHLGPAMLGELGPVQDLRAKPTAGRSVLNAR